MIEIDTSIKEVVLIDDSNSLLRYFETCFSKKCSWLFQEYNVGSLTIANAKEILDSFILREDYILLININIKLKDCLRIDSKGLYFYRGLLNNLQSGAPEPFILYSFFDIEYLRRESNVSQLISSRNFMQLPLNRFSP